MKLILTQEVQNLGGPGDVVEVKDGYGRNFLVPQGLALQWTRGGEKQIETIRRARAQRAVKELATAQTLKSSIEGLKVKLTARAGGTGRLFGAVTPSDVVEAISSTGGPDVDKRQVVIAEPIRTLGKHEVSVRLHPEVTAKVSFEVVSG
ncbi:large subunit ribosomal protein L9 [Motilibacter rhizosphaerae]|uniref:Large ribosomal subunit protein bL9 n=1 Tax=Motilibacter rhizosphaerae TaxID=598652 RepID=A0A4Q7NV80_9ACTN|nr:50S ribosomal protein L9 [Motilibacter rhizosphaerae]RZS91156.1 large subunit ribosomal protein L9 [Motilibacter rhizosphaerae]